MNYAAKRGGTELADNLRKVVKANEQGAVSGLSEFELFEIRDGLEIIFKKKVK